MASDYQWDRWFQLPLLWAGRTGVGLTILLQCCKVDPSLTGETDEERNGDLSFLPSSSCKRLSTDPTLASSRATGFKSLRLDKTTIRWEFLGVLLQFPGLSEPWSNAGIMVALCR
uniref:Uncharacterized protein n=1 Tax=Grammatophora oceanica TaxID=210454 RepID=A0A7S1Y3Y3_9STRA|mmetsp:Transcript_1775/g.2398  ORF Transcript_1775/g.2398 Transcript_1775/m.2398 type:complete len:115 (+) Transcript_1775:66-410(+)